MPHHRSLKPYLNAVAWEWKWSLARHASPLQPSTNLTAGCGSGMKKSLAKHAPPLQPPSIPKGCGLGMKSSYLKVNQTNPSSNIPKRCGLGMKQVITRHASPLPPSNIDKGCGSGMKVGYYSLPHHGSLREYLHAAAWEWKKLYMWLQHHSNL